MPNRRTDADTFALGMWASKVEADLARVAEDAPKEVAAALTALRKLLTEAKDTGDLNTLDKLRGHFRDAEFDGERHTVQTLAAEHGAAVEKSGVKDK